MAKVEVKSNAILTPISLTQIVLLVVVEEVEREEPVDETRGADEKL